MNMRRCVAVLGLALTVCVGGRAALAQHEGHNHGEAEGPAAGIEDIAARAATVGQHFQLVALPKDGRLVIFLDDAASNVPAQGARIEILAGDALVTAEETAPGLYLVAPWPAEGLPAEDAEKVELVATVVAEGREEVLLARMSGAEGQDHDGHDHSGHDHGATAARTAPLRAALWDGIKPLALPLTAGLVALVGAVAAVRSSGRRRWFGALVTGASIVTMLATTGLV